MKSLRPVTFFFFLISAFCLLPSALNAQRPKVGLVLSGGGAAGLAHIGVIKVLEEAGIPIDYVGGTSMGSIVGALYALGYTPEQLEEMALTEDWESLLTDEIPRNNMTYEYKEDLEKYFYSFPITKTGIQLPAGLVSGQNITNMLAGLTWQAYNIRDFNRFPRPFLCIGADIVTGKEVVLNSGVLHDAIRASMSIPTAFSPVEVQGKLMVDGGFINNFPAEHVKAMGADILIGVDVQRDLFKKSELNNMVNLLKQVSSLTREDINQKNRDLCDILIRPNTPGAGILTFWMADSIIRDGERTAREQWETLKALGDNLRKLGGEEIHPVKPLPRYDSLFIREISYTGLEKVTPALIRAKMDLPFPAWLTPDDIFRAMQRAYGTNEFTKITYQLDPVPGGARLVVRAKEKVKNLVHIGFHYDNLFNVSLLMKGEMRNLWFKGDRLNLDLTLGENPNVTASYFFLSRKKRDWGIQTEFNRIHAYEYDEGHKIGSYLYRDALMNLVLRTTFHEEYAVSTGIQGEFASVAPDITFLQLGAFNSPMINYYIRFDKDNFNRVPYPTNGEKVEIALKWINNFTSAGYQPALSFNYRHQRAFRMTDKFSFQPSMMLSMAFGDSIPYPYRSYLGGLGYYHKTVIPFVGMNYMERSGNFGLVFRGDLQYNIKGNHYLILRNNIGKSFNTFTEFKDTKTILAGTGFTYGYASPVGPVEVTLMAANGDYRPILFVNLGYWMR